MNDLNAALLDCLNRTHVADSPDLAVLDLVGSKELSPADAASLRMIAGVLSVPVGRMGKHVKPDGMWFDPANLAERETSILASILPHLQNDEAVARVGDALWLGGRNWVAARSAVGAYLRRARATEGVGDWYVSAHRYVRATDLAASLGRRAELYQRCLNEVVAAVRRVAPGDATFFSMELMDLLVNHRVREQASEFSSYAMTIAKGAEEILEFWRAQNYWTVAIRLQELAQSYQGGDAREKLADCLVKEARSRASGPTASFLVAARFVMDAITILRKIGRNRDRVRELSVELKQYEANGVSELKRVSIPIDIPDEAAEAARGAVSGKALPDALLQFADIAASPRIAHLETAAQQIGAGSISNHIAVDFLDREGAAIADRPAQTSGSDDGRRARMIEFANKLRAVIVNGLIMPAATQIVEEHAIREMDLLPLLLSSAWVPPGRELIYARGFVSGFNGDLMVAAHLLIPQMENSLRWVLQEAGVPTITFRADDHQVQQPFGELLFSPAAKTLLGEDLQFDLVSLLVEPVGPQLRNDIAHGRVPSGDFSSVPVLYCWWLALRLCLLTPRPEVAAPAQWSV